jgi:predicted HicB family RNase H-like nuclease
MKRVRVLVSKELKKAIKDAARQMGISMAEFVRRAVACGIEAAAESAARGKRGAR